MSAMHNEGPFGAMRRKDRAMTEPAAVEAVIRQAHLMRIALADGGKPFLVPVFYGFDGKALYFHSAKTGTKIEILKRNPNICFEISVDHGIIESEEACDFEAKHRTVIGFGTAVFVEDAAEKKKALDLVVANFTTKTFDYSPTNLKRTCVVRIDIESITGKTHGF